MVQQLDGGAPRPLQIVEHEQDGPLSRERGQRDGHRVVEAPPFGVGIAGYGRRWWVSLAGHAGHEPGQLRATIADERRQRRHVEGRAEVGERGGERLVGHRRLVGAHAVEDGVPAPVHAPGELGGESGLAGPGLARHEHDLPRPRARLRPRRFERGPGLQSRYERERLDHGEHRRQGNRPVALGGEDLDTLDDAQKAAVERAGGHEAITGQRAQPPDGGRRQDGAAGEIAGPGRESGRRGDRRPSPTGVEPGDLAHRETRGRSGFPGGQGRRDGGTHGRERQGGPMWADVDDLGLALPPVLTRATVDHEDRRRVRAGSVHR